MKKIKGLILGCLGLLGVTFISTATISNVSKFNSVEAEDATMVPFLGVKNSYIGIFSDSNEFGEAIMISIPVLADYESSLHVTHGYFHSLGRTPTTASESSFFYLYDQNGNKVDAHIETCGPKGLILGRDSDSTTGHDGYYPYLNYKLEIWDGFTWIDGPSNVPGLEGLSYSNRKYTISNKVAKTVYKCVSTSEGAAWELVEGGTSSSSSSSQSPTTHTSSTSPSSTVLSIGSITNFDDTLFNFNAVKVNVSNPNLTSLFGDISTKTSTNPTNFDTAVRLRNTSGQIQPLKAQVYDHSLILNNSLLGGYSPYTSMNGWTLAFDSNFTFVETNTFDSSNPPSNKTFTMSQSYIFKCTSTASGASWVITDKENQGDGPTPTDKVVLNISQVKNHRDPTWNFAAVRICVTSPNLTSLFGDVSTGTNTNPTNWDNKVRLRDTEGNCYVTKAQVFDKDLIINSSLLGSDYVNYQSMAGWTLAFDAELVFYETNSIDEAGNPPSYKKFTLSKDYIFKCGSGSDGAVWSITDKENEEKEPVPVGSGYEFYAPKAPYYLSLLKNNDISASIQSIKSRLTKIRHFADGAYGEPIDIDTSAITIENQSDLKCDEPGTYSLNVSFIYNSTKYVNNILVKVYEQGDVNIDDVGSNDDWHYALFCSAKNSSGNATNLDLVWQTYLPKYKDTNCIEYKRADGSNVKIIAVAQLRQDIVLVPEFLLDENRNWVFDNKTEDYDERLKTKKYFKDGDTITFKTGCPIYAWTGDTKLEGGNPLYPKALTGEVIEENVFTTDVVYKYTTDYTKAGSWSVYKGYTGLYVPYKDISLNVGKTFKLACDSIPAGTTLGEITYKSNDTSIAKVDSFGKVTGVKKGTTTITVTLKDKDPTDDFQGGTFTEDVTVTVTDAVTKIICDESTLTVEYNTALDKLPLENLGAYFAYGDGTKASKIDFKTANYQILGDYDPTLENEEQLLKLSVVYPETSTKVSCTFYVFVQEQGGGGSSSSSLPPTTSSQSSSSSQPTSSSQSSSSSIPTTSSQSSSSESSSSQTSSSETPKPEELSNNLGDSSFSSLGMVLGIGAFTLVILTFILSKKKKV